MMQVETAPPATQKRSIQKAEWRVIALALAVAAVLSVITYAVFGYHPL